MPVSITMLGGLLGTGLRMYGNIFAYGHRIAPATNPATPASRTLLGLEWAAAMPTTKLVVETIPS